MPTHAKMRPSSFPTCAKPVSRHMPPKNYGTPQSMSEPPDMKAVASPRSIERGSKSRLTWPRQSVGFFELSDGYAILNAAQDPSVEIDAVVPWEEFCPTLDRVRRKPEAERKSRAGRNPMDAVAMFKTRVVGALCNLTDDQIEYHVRDRLSARTVPWPRAGGTDHIFSHRVHNS